MRILKKLVRKLYHLIWFLSLFILFILPVYATDGSTNGSIRTSDIYQSTQAQCYNTSHNSITTNFINNVGYSSYYQCNLNSDRGFLSLNVNHSLVTDTLYQITLYIGNNGNKPIGNPGNYVAVGSGITDANNNNRDGYNRVTIWGFNDTWNILSYIQVDNGDIDTQPRTSATGMYFITFTVPSDGKAFLNIPVYFGSSTTQLYYYGYNLQVLGRVGGLTRSDVQSVINSSGLATANSVNEVKQGVNEVKQELNSIDSTLKNDDAPTIDLSDIQTSNTPISDLVTLPLTLLNSIYNGISGSCSNWSLLLPFNHTILLQCFTISDYVGSSVATIIDCAICLFMAYRIILLFIAVFNDITTLSDTYTNYVKRGRY